MGTRLDRLQLSSLLSWMGIVRDDDDDGDGEAAAVVMLASADWRAARREASASRRWDEPTAWFIVRALWF